MTASEVNIAILQKLDKTSSLELPAFEQEEIEFWVNDTILKFIDDVDIDETQIDIDDIKNLIVPSSTLSVSSSNYYPNNYCFNLPSNYYRYLSDNVSITFTGINGQSITKRVATTPVTHDRYTVKLRDPFSEHNLYLDYAEPLQKIIDEEIVYITDGNYIINNSYLSYIKKPETFDISGGVTIDLPEHTHRRVVDMTVKRMLENIENPRYQTMSYEINSEEN